MKALAGNKNRLALECILNKENHSLGNLFLCVNGIRFGESRFDFKIDVAVYHTLSYFKLPNIDLTSLSSCSAEEIFESHSKASSFDPEYKDINDLNLGKIPAVEYMPDFVEKIVDIDHCYFRFGNYAFDSCSIMLIPMKDRLKLYIEDRDSGIHTDIITTEKEFLGLWKEIAVKLP